MVGSVAVIGLPNENSVLKYYLGGESVSGVQPMESTQQTLTNASIEQSNGQTVLTFTKLLSEPNELDLSAIDSNVFIYALGSSNTLALHQQDGAFSTALTPCIVVEDSDNSISLPSSQPGSLPPSPTSAQSQTSPSPVPRAPTVEILSNSEEGWPVDRAHGICMAGAWAVLIPIAISSSIVREFFPDGLWFVLHRALNALGLALTLVGFALIVHSIQEDTLPGEKPHHFSENAHSIVGLIVVVLAVLQATSGLLRPHAPTANVDEVDDEKSREIDETIPALDGTKNVKTKARSAWEYGHRIVGFTTLGLAWYNCHTGMDLYTETVGGNESGLHAILWVLMGVILAPTVALRLYYTFQRA